MPDAIKSICGFISFAMRVVSRHLGVTCCLRCWSHREEKEEARPWEYKWRQSRASLVVVKGEAPTLWGREEELNNHYGEFASFSKAGTFPLHSE